MSIPTRYWVYDTLQDVFAFTQRSLRELLPENSAVVVRITIRSPYQFGELYRTEYHMDDIASEHNFVLRSTSYGLRRNGEMPIVSVLRWARFEFKRS